jgi:hypothetical protein
MVQQSNIFIKSREGLQALIKNRDFLYTKYLLFEKLIQALWDDMYDTTILQGETRHLFDFKKFIQTEGNTDLKLKVLTDSSFRPELKELLKKEYPGCYVAYLDTKQYDNDEITIHNEIIIDWS